jgi:hypothetical protein
MMLLQPSFQRQLQLRDLLAQPPFGQLGHLLGSLDAFQQSVVSFR